MNTKEQTIQECIQELQEDISEKEKLIEYLYLFDTYAEEGLTEEEYHKFCLTGLRCSDLLGEALMQAMPFLIYEGRSPNHFSFRTEDYPQIMKICIPSSWGREAAIFVDEYYYDDEKTAVSLMKRHLLTHSIYEHDIRTCEVFLKADNAIQRAKILFSNLPSGIALIRYMATNPHRKYKQAVSEKLVATRNKQDELAHKIDKLIRETGEKRKKQQTVLLHYARELLSWTKKVIVLDKYSQKRAEFYSQGEKIECKENEQGKVERLVNY